MASPSPREQKAVEIAASARIAFASGAWWVSSQSGAGKHRVVLDTMFPTCSCKDFELRDQPCKHMLAVRLFIEQQESGEPQPVQTEPTPKVKKPTYRQDWPNYNLAQTNEKRHFKELLHDLCRGIKDPPPKGGTKGGRPRIPLRDAVFAAAFKVYSTVSGRRFSCDLADAQTEGHITVLPHYNSVFRCLEDKALTPILHALIRESSLPLSAIETDFAADSSGFCTSRFTRWWDVKYGVTREKADWVKCHLMCGVQTNVVTAVEILDKHAGDSPQFPALVKATAKGFTIREASADMAYAATDNFQAVKDVGGTLYAPFKSNTTGAVGGIFEKAFHYFCLHREEFLAHYHKRSNVESTFSMVKAKFRDHVRSKTDVAMGNEVLCKLLCHNICCLISAIYELKIDPVFWKDLPKEEPCILPMVRYG